MNSEKSLLDIILSFSIPCKKSDYADYLVNFELFLIYIRYVDILSNKIWILLKQKLRKRHYHTIEDMVLISLKIFLIMNLLPYESPQNKDLIIQKSEKRKPVVTVDRHD